MTNVKYKKTDILPLVLIVLTYISTHLLIYVYKIALDNQLKDLNGTVDPEDLNQEALDQIYALDDPLSVLVKEAWEEIAVCINQICMLHGLDQMELCLNPRLRSMADDFYEKLSLYWSIQRNGGNVGELYRYTFCIDLTIYRLCETIILEKKKFPRIVYNRWRHFRKANFGDFDKFDGFELRLLVNLGEALNNYCNRIADMTGNERQKGIRRKNRLLKV
jgi:hypothetical protein